MKSLWLVVNIYQNRYWKIRDAHIQYNADICATNDCKCCTIFTQNAQNVAQTANDDQKLKNESTVPIYQYIATMQVHKNEHISQEAVYYKISHLNRALKTPSVRGGFRWGPPWPNLTSHDLVTCDDTPGILESDTLARRKVKTWWRRTSEGERRSVLSHESRVNEPHRGLMYGPAWGRCLAERRCCKPH